MVTKNPLPDVLRHLKPTAREARDFIVADTGSGPFLLHWDKSLLGPLPTDSELAAADAAVTALAAKREGQKTLYRLAQEYVVALIVAQEFSDTTRLRSIKNAIAAWKSANPGVIP